MICHKCNYLVEQSFRFLKTIEKSNAILCEKFVNQRINEENRQIIKEDDVTTGDEIIENHVEKLDDEMDDLNWSIEMLDDKLATDYLYDNESVLEYHKNDLNSTVKFENDTNSNDNCYKCPVCDEICGDSLEEAVKHVTLHNITESQTCENCNQTFKDSSYFSKHNCEVFMYNCKNCSLLFTDKNNLKYHLENDHSKIKSEVNQCSICNQVFATDNKRKIHENKYHSHGPSIMCPNCPKKFYYNSGLKRHLQSHTGEKLFGCNICEKRFPSQAEVNRHTKYHTNERQHKCTICDKRFIESGHLLNHVNLVHLNNKRFKCEFCDKKFISNFKLKRHQKSRACEMVSLLKKKNNDNVPEQKINSAIKDVDENLSSSGSEWKLINLPDGTSGITNGVNGRTLQVIGIENDNKEIQDYLLLDTELNFEDDNQLSTEVPETPFIPSGSDHDFMNWD